MSDVIRSGAVKWWNTQKGYGFIVPDDGGPDVMCHATAMTRDVHWKLGEGVKVRFTAEETKRGQRVNWLQLGADRFEVWYLPDDCSHPIACKDHQLNVIKVFLSMGECKLWTDKQFNRR